LTPDAEQFIYRAIRDILEDLAASGEASPAADAGAVPGEAVPPPRPESLVLGCPARDEADELTLRMLAHLLGSSAGRFEVVPAGTPTAETAVQVKRQRPAVVCIAALPPGGLVQTHQLCKRLLAQFADLKILAGLWGVTEDLEGVAGRLRSSGADQVVTNLLDARDQVVAYLQARSPVEETRAPA
jgi:hypothetical protein